MMCAGLEKVGEGAPAAAGAEALHTALSFAWRPGALASQGPQGMHSVPPYDKVPSPLSRAPFSFPPLRFGDDSDWARKESARRALHLT